MDGFEKRLGLVEGDLRSLRADVASINSRLGVIEGKLTTLTDQVVGKIPTAWTLFTVMISTLVSGIALLGGALTLLKYLGLSPQ
jgi:hypothetical protein